MRICRRSRVSLCVYILLMLVIISCTKTSDASLGAKQVPVSESRLLLGTSCRITLYDRNHEALFASAFNRIEKIEHEMSTRIPTSDISQVSAAAGTGTGVTVSADTLEVIQEALWMAQISNGAFDPTIGPLVTLWGIGTEDPRIPEPEEIATALKRVDYTAVSVDPELSQISLTAPNMALDLGGIAKGFAADEVKTVLTDNGITSALINLGGNVLTLGTKPDGTPWRIGIQDPTSSRGKYILVVSLVDKSVVTSGIYERFFERDGVHYHHILDTTTGYPVNSGLMSVSIIASDSSLADALSTTVFSLGREKGLRLIESYKDVEAICITKEKKIYMSSGLLAKTIPYSLTDTSYTIMQ